MDDWLVDGGNGFLDGGLVIVQGLFRTPLDGFGRNEGLDQFGIGRQVLILAGDSWFDFVAGEGLIERIAQDGLLADGKGFHLVCPVVLHDLFKNFHVHGTS